MPHQHTYLLLGRKMNRFFYVSTPRTVFFFVFSQTYEWWDDDPELTEDDREEINNFEVWLEGPTVVHYHERAEGRVDMDDEQMQKVLDDLEIRVVDEVILGQYVNEDLQFLLPGFRVAEQRGKQFPEL